MHTKGYFDHPNLTGHNFSSIASYVTMNTSSESSKWAYISGVTLKRLKWMKNHISILPVFYDVCTQYWFLGINGSLVLLFL